MEKYIDLIKNSYSGYWNYLKYELIDLNHWDNFFYGLILISVLVWILEIAFPWRKEQALFRKDFWLDTFYMFFNGIRIVSYTVLNGYGISIKCIIL